MFRFFGNSNYSNIIIQNGKVINATEERGQERTFDETKAEKADSIDSIYIDSESIDVAVLVKNTSEITMRFFGSACVISGDIKFEVNVIDKELRVNVKTTGNISNSKLKINITIPSEKVFRSFTFKSQSADLEIWGNLYTKNFKAKSMSGDVSGKISFESASIKTMSGDANVEIFAENEIRLDFSSMSGDLNAKLHFISSVKLNSNTMSGEVTNRYQERKNGYIAQIDASTMSGDIEIK